MQFPVKETCSIERAALTNVPHLAKKPAMRGGGLERTQSKCYHACRYRHLMASREEAPADRPTSQ
jgi:hypothetical protein